MISQINHIGIAVNSLDAHIPYYRDVLKLKFLGIEEVAEQKVKGAMFQVGEAKIELLEPTAEDSPIARYIEKKGEGIHHLALQTDDVEAEMKVVSAAGLRIIDTTPRDGAHGSKIAFIHPKSSGRVLTELCQVGGKSHE